MSPWLPRFRVGSALNEMIDRRGTHGWYIQFDWFGLMLAIEIGKADRD